jgi:hypothetical protein
MGTTKQIPPNEWQAYFDRISRTFLAEDTAETVTVEVMSPTLGDQIEAQSVRLDGIAYDPKSRALEVWMGELDHLAWDPTELWVVEGDDGFPSSLEIVRADGPRELLHFHRSGPRTPRYQVVP